METVDFSRFFLSLAFIILLIWLSAYLVKRFGLDRKLRGTTGAGGRLQISEVLYLDPRRKLILVRADASEYLLMLSGDQVTLVSALPTKKDSV